MIEKFRLNDKDIWIVIEPHLEHCTNNDPQEYFTASYHVTDPVDHPEGVLFTDKNQAPRIFESPVQVLAYAQETLLHAGIS